MIAGVYRPVGDLTHCGRDAFAAEVRSLERRGRPDALGVRARHAGRGDQEQDGNRGNSSVHIGVSRFKVRLL
jgi:hypothetical protein